MKIENKNFRKYLVSSGKIVLGGKSAENNEELIQQVGKNEYVLHTESPGSPFCNIKANAKETTKEDLIETAVFCAKYSQAWKKSLVKKDVKVHIFLGKDIFKLGEMKTGTFGVKKFKEIIVKKQDIIEFERGLEK